jgi:purine-cytosine permease-like protein
MTTVRKLPDTFKAYEDGKSRRYSLLFTVNGGAFAVAKLFPSGNPCAVLGKLTLAELSLGMIVFTVLLTVDIFLFGQHLRNTVSQEAMGSTGDTLPMFGTPGKLILILIGLLICVGWFLVGVAGSNTC